MGAEGSKTERFQNKKYPFVIVSMPSEKYSAKEKIEGQIILSLTGKEFSIKSMSVNLIKIEKWEVITQSKLKPSKTTTFEKEFHYSSFNINLEEKSNEKDEENFFTLGYKNYIFPFKLDIPLDASPSLSVTKPKGYKAEISYYVVVRAEGKGGTVDIGSKIHIFSENNKGSLELTKSSTPKIKTLFQEKGTVNLVGFIPYSSFLLDDDLPISFFIDKSHASISGKFLLVKIKRFLELKSNSGEVFTTIEEKIQTITLRVSQPPGTQKLYNCIIKKNPIEVPTATGEFIKCYYTLKASLYFDSFILGKYRPRVIFDICFNEKDTQHATDLSCWNVVRDNDLIVANEIADKKIQHLKELSTKEFEDEDGFTHVVHDIKQ